MPAVAQIITNSTHTIVFVVGEKVIHNRYSNYI